MSKPDMAASRPSLCNGEDFLFLCQLDDLDDPGSKGFENVAGEVPFFVVRRGDTVHGFRNSCPHYGAPLDWKPDAFLSVDRSLILCSMHGALFDIASGICVRGPCPGRTLAPVDVFTVDGEVLLKR